ncbi:hypothetical protein HDV05_003017 [Chytridiales sp. JEL 0842]|nr:hypothetical protein HDV05_003017 [Chytridiales sp. JEL 0842]
MVSVNYSGGQPKDTLANIQSTKEFVVNTIHEDYVESANHCSGAFPPDFDESVLAGLEMVESENVEPKRVAQSPISFECKLESVKMVHKDDGQVATGVVFGRIVNVVGWEKALVKKNGDRGGPLVGDLGVTKPVSRLGGNMYGRTTEGYEIARP